MEAQETYGIRFSEDPQYLHPASDESQQARSVLIAECWERLTIAVAKAVAFQLSRLAYPGSSLLYGVAKLKAARLGARDGGVEAMGYSSSIASTSVVCTDSGGLPSPSAASVVRSGRALLGPPT